MLQDYREGITDLRYTLLAESIATNSTAPAAVQARAVAVLEQLRSLPVGNGLQAFSSLPTYASLSALREEIADLLIAACPSSACFSPTPVTAPVSIPARESKCNFTANWRGWTEVVEIKMQGSTCCKKVPQPCAGCVVAAVSGGMGLLTIPGVYEVQGPLPVSILLNLYSAQSCHICNFHLRPVFCQPCFILILLLLLLLQVWVCLDPRSTPALLCSASSAGNISNERCELKSGVSLCNVTIV